MSFINKKPRLCIIGSGLTGLAAAYILSRLDIEIDIITKQNLSDANIFDNDTRTSTLSHSVAGMMEDLWVYWGSGFIKHIYTFEDEILSFDLNPEDEPMGYVVHNNELKQGILEGIKQRSNINIINNEGVEEITENIGSASIKVSSGQVFEANLVLSCDGKYGGLHKLFGIQKNIINYDHTAIVFNIDHTNKNRNIATEQFNNGNILAVLPLPNCNQSSVIWTVKKSHARFLKNHNDFDSFFNIAMQRTRHVGSVTKCHSRSYYDISLSRLKKRFCGRTLFVGDSFSSVHPVAGQGFNTTMRNIAKIHSYIESMMSSGIDIGNYNNLKTLSLKCYPDNIAIAASTHALIRLFECKNPIIKFARNLGIAGMESIPSLKSKFVSYASD